MLNVVVVTLGQERLPVFPDDLSYKMTLMSFDFAGDVERTRYPSDHCQIKESEVGRLDASIFIKAQENSQLGHNSMRPVDHLRSTQVNAKLGLFFPSQGMMLILRPFYTSVSSTQRHCAEKGRIDVSFQRQS